MGVIAVVRTYVSADQLAVRPAELHSSMQQRRQRMEEALRRLDRLHDSSSEEFTPAGKFIPSLIGILPDPDNFKPGILKRHATLWQAYFERISGRKLTVNQRMVMKVVREGVKLHFVHPNGKGQHRQKQRVLHRMLRQTEPGRAFETFFENAEPGKVWFANHASALKHADFVTQEVGNMRRPE